MRPDDKPFAIISDSSLDLPESVIQENDIHVVPFSISFDRQTYQKEREELPVSDLYQRMVDEPGTYPVTSCPSIEDYEKVMEPLASQGQNILVICLSSRFTSSIQSAQIAAEMIKEKYPDIEICVMDSTCATVLQGLFVLQACALRDAGISLAQSIKRLDELKDTAIIFFTVGDLDYLIHGGRVGKAKGAIANTLDLKPMIIMRNGELFSSGVARSRSLSKKRAMKLLEKYVADNQLDLSRYQLATGYGWDSEEGALYNQEVRDFLTRKYQYAGSLPDCQIGATIGVHTGPHPIGLGMIEKALPDGADSIGF